MPEHVRLQIIERMRGNKFGAAAKGRVHSQEAKDKVSAGLKVAWTEGRISPRKPIFTAEEQREKKRQYSKLRYAADPERFRAEQKEWREANKARKKEISDAYLDRHRDRLNAKAREKNKDPSRKTYMQAYSARHRRENRDLYQTYDENRRARQAGADGAHTEAEWLACVQAYGGKCGYCARAPERLCRDHNVPLVRGGSNDISNIVPACGSCNSAKGTLTGDEFRRRLAGEDVPIDPRWSEQLRLARANSRRFRAKKRVAA